MKRVSRGVDRIEVTFDDKHLVPNAGMLLVATLATRLGMEELVDATVRLVGRVGGALPGRKVLTLVHAIVAGGSYIDHADVLRAGATQAVLDHRVMAPSTLGTFLAGVHLWPCPPARGGRGQGVVPSLGRRCGPGQRAPGGRHRLHHL